MGVVGHSIEECQTFKANVLDLIEAGYLSVATNTAPTITANPMPNHERQVGAIETEVRSAFDPDRLPASRRVIFELLQNTGYLNEAQKSECPTPGTEFCHFHGGYTDHDVDGCLKFSQFLRQLAARGILSIGSDVEAVCTTEKQQFSLVINKTPVRGPAQGPVSLVINKPPLAAPSSGPRPVIIEPPAPFPYQTNRAVPWRYEGVVKYTTGQLVKPVEQIANIVGPSGVTRSGRVYAPPNAQKEDKPKENKEIDDEFLRIVKRSEYDVIDQLKKTPARISVLSLILTSKAHREVLQRALDQAYVAPDVPVERIASVMNIARNASTISFSEDEIVSSGRPKALHITIKCCNFTIGKVLIDGGSALNILPLTTFEALAISPTEMVDSEVVVRAFDGTRREVIGAINLPIEVGPTTFEAEFQVMDVRPSYTILLGRPWIHGAGAVPSTLHQSVKFVSHGKIITVRGEDGLLISRSDAIPYVESAEQEMESSFQTLEIEEGQVDPTIANPVVANIMRKSGYEPGKGLGAQLQGPKTHTEPPANKNRTGLGYKPEEDGKRKAKAEVPPPRTTFRLASEAVGTPCVATIHTGDPSGGGLAAWIQAGEQDLNNWEAEDIPDIVFVE